MTREIKFRAWDKKENKWLSFDEDDPIQDDFGYVEDKYWTFEFDFNEDRVALMQYAGLKDKNGKEIYEGDILIWEEALTGKKERKHLVKWNYADLNALELGSEYKLLEVIGNIYENPELVKELV